MKNNLFLTIIIATLDSQETLPRVLDSIHKQTFPLNKIEILVVDAGSKDKTIDIAKQYGCRIIPNPKVLPAYAKYIGYKEAKGRYVMYLDSDEVIASERSIQRKIDVFLQNPSVHAVTGSGYISPSEYSFINRYINEFGDPFSFFFYRISKSSDFFINLMKRRYKIVKENNNYILFNFQESKNLPIFELVAMGSMIDSDFMKNNFPEIIKNPGLIPHMFYLLISKNVDIGIVKDDPLIHYSSNTCKKYLGKIRSRIIQNIFTPAKDGFRGRNQFSYGIRKYKHYFFIPYAFSILFPLFDSLTLIFTRRHLGYFIHVFLSLYTATIVLYYSILRLFGYTPILKSYGQMKKV
ncbi:MAG: glycosyltransferase family 2 protein [Candidatus Calescibacterium sp.]|nr:glycosyltransferase family 2 protein [Candidatus Calescibacterium sp.]